MQRRAPLSSLQAVQAALQAPGGQLPPVAYLPPPLPASRGSSADSGLLLNQREFEAAFEQCVLDPQAFERQVSTLDAPACCMSAYMEIFKRIHLKGPGAAPAAGQHPPVRLPGCDLCGKRARQAGRPPQAATGKLHAPVLWPCLLARPCVHSYREALVTSRSHCNGLAELPSAVLCRPWLVQTC